MITVTIVLILSALLFQIAGYNVILAWNSYKYKPKTVGMIFFLILFVYTIHNPDYKVYELVYLNGSGPFQQESIGFSFFSELSKKIGIHTYQGFLFLIALFIWILIHSWAKKLNDVHYVVFFYSLFIMYYDVIQIRNAISTFCIISILLLYLYAKKNIITIVLIFLLISIAIIFHPISVLQVLLIICAIFNQAKNKFSFSFFKFGMMFMLVLFLSKSSLTWLGSNFIYFRKISLYMTYSLDWKSFIIWLSSSLVMLYALYQYGVKSLLVSKCVMPEFKKKLSLLFTLSLFSIVISPLTLYMDEIARIYRFFFLIMFLIFSMIRKKINSRNRKIIFNTIVIINLAFLTMWMIRGINFDNYW